MLRADSGSDMKTAERLRIRQGRPLTENIFLPIIVIIVLFAAVAGGYLLLSARRRAAVRGLVPQGPGAAEPAKILYIADSSNSVKVMEKLVGNDLGLMLVSAASAQEGLVIARSNRFDLVLMDLHLTGMDGFTGKMMLDATGYQQQVPIIAVSADLDRGIFERARAAGFVDCITRPFAADKVQKVIKAALASQPIHATAR